MKLMFELSKEQKTLPCAEVIACLNAENIMYTVITTNEDVLIVEIKPNDSIIQRLAERLAFTFVIDELLFSCPATLDDIVRYAEKHPLMKDGSIAIRCKNRSSSIHSQQLIDRLGDIYTKNRLVNLTHPEIELRAVVTENTAYVGIKKATLETSHFQKRRGHFRPFLLPITLHPKVARALVNLSSIKKQETLLDPFCGTGGILLEAGLIGARVIGSDIEQKMIDGCKKTLDFYSIKNYELSCCDIGNIPQSVSIVDAVITDFPYGKATTTKGEALAMLYERAFASIAFLLKKSGKAVVGLSDKSMVCLGEKYLSLVEIHEFRVHRSLTRYFVVYQK
ncbi:MAG: methyltransferase domain-containing protein [Thermoplasmata archaeon]|nr:methyltransferase domain-containing protein [Thermoplasmata archaeon]MBE3139070.1 methyltransferase domain-containing protein [Thermoplasmata archaeon]